MSQGHWQGCSPVRTAASPSRPDVGPREEEHEVLSVAPCALNGIFIKEYVF